MPHSKTQKYVEEHNNKCPTCNKMLIEKDKEVASLLRKLTLGNGSGSSGNSNAQGQGVRLKPPTFNGKGDPKHFFVKLTNYLETYRIVGTSETVRVLKSCLEGSALDLFLSLSFRDQYDLELLKETFQNHFQPLSHTIVETETFMKIKKKVNERVSEFYAALKKKADELSIEESLLKITFISGLEKEAQ